MVIMLFRNIFAVHNLEKLITFPNISFPDLWNVSQLSAISREAFDNTFQDLMTVFWKTVYLLVLISYFQ